MVAEDEIGRVVELTIEKNAVLTVIINGEKYTFDKVTAPFDEAHNGYVADMTDIKAALAEQGYDVTPISDLYVVAEDEIGRVVEVTIEKNAVLTVIINGEKYTFDKVTAPFDEAHNGYVADMTDIKAALAEQGYDVTPISDLYVVAEDEIGRVVEVTIEKNVEEELVLTVIINGIKYTFDKVTAPFDKAHNGYVADMTDIKATLADEGYNVTPISDLYVVTEDELGRIVELTVEKNGTLPEETYDDATLTVVYVDGKETVGTQVLKFNGLVGEEHTFTSKDLTVPEKYEFVKAFADHPVAYGAEDTVTVEVRKIEVPTPDEMADATLHIIYTKNYTQVGEQFITVTGKKGESYTFTSENVTLKIPAGYKYSGKLESVKVAYGDTADTVLRVAPISTGGGSGSSGGSGGGSGSGGSRSVSTAKKLTNGQWILDSVGWWYPFSDNTYAKGGWYYLEWQNKKDWYYFDNTGYLVSGWFEENGNKYYLHDVHDGTFGRMYIGWNKIGNQWYYFNDTTTGTFGALDPNAQVPAELLNQ